MYSEYGKTNFFAEKQFRLNLKMSVYVILRRKDVVRVGRRFVLCED